MFWSSDARTSCWWIRRNTCLTKMLDRNPWLKDLKPVKVLITLDARRSPKRFQHLRKLRCLRKSLLMCWNVSKRSVPTTHYYWLLRLADFTYSVTRKCLVLSILLFLHRRSLNTDNMRHTPTPSFLRIISSYLGGKITDTTCRRFPGSRVVFWLSLLLRVLLNVCSQS